VVRFVDLEKRFWRNWEGVMFIILIPFLFIFFGLSLQKIRDHVTSHFIKHLNTCFSEARRKFPMPIFA